MGQRAGRVGRVAGVAWVLVLAAFSMAAQEPEGPPPPSRSGASGAQPGLELLPELGRVGAQVGLSLGSAWFPFDAGRGWQGSGFIDLPLAQGFGGRLSYEIFVGLGSSTGPPFVVTDAVALVANLAAGYGAADALAGPPRAPFPVRRLVRTRLRVLQVSPFALKHTFTGLDRAHLRPYLAAGVDAVVVISKQLPERDESLEFSGSAPFDDALIGGLIAQAPELAARGLPTGQGNVEVGFHAGGGLELRLSRGLSLDLDYRFTRLGGGHNLHAAGAGLGIHW